MIAPHLDPERRHDFKLLVEVIDGNPNGDPDADGRPRLDPETRQGLMSDACIKRQVRNWAGLQMKDRQGYRLYVQHRGILGPLHEEAYAALKLKSTGPKQARVDIDAARRWMCDTFFDVRWWGAVMSTGTNCGQVQGPVQLSFARSVDPVLTLDHSITRVAVTREEDAAYDVSDENEITGAGKQTEMGRKATVPYGLYVASGSVTPSFAQQTGFTSEDLALLWRALVNCWDLRRSASSGVQACRGLVIFTHTSALGDAPAHQLLGRVRIARRPEVVVPRAFDDYEVTIEEEDLPEGVTIARLAS